MKSQRTNLEFALNVASRRELLESPEPWWQDLSVQDARKVTRRLRELGEPCTPHRIGFIHSYTTDLLDPWLEMHGAVHGIDPKLFHAPYGFNVLQSEPDSLLSQFDPQTTLFMLRSEDLHPRLMQQSAVLDRESRDTIATEAIDSLLGIIGRFRKLLSGELVISILPSHREPVLGEYDAQAEVSEQAWWRQLRSDIGARLREDFDSVALLDDEQLLKRLGCQQFFDMRYFYSAQFPFSQLAASEVSRKIVSRAVLRTSPKAKVLVLDADNTLWGGVVGEDGPTGIGLGPEYPGCAYVDFQRRLLGMQQRGLILAMCSKNNPADVQEILDSHPHQVLRSEHFAAMRVNWQPKSENIREIAKELNLGLDSFVFVDDSDYECALVRREVPEVTVVQTPSRPVSVPTCLDRLARLEIASLTREDLEKSRMYAQERVRQERRATMSAEGGGLDDYLASLGMSMRVFIDEATQATRLAQLTQKTNQFNLTTRRYDEQQIRRFMEDPDWLVASFSLEDSFGDSGIVGLLLVQRPGGSAHAQIDTLLMSCRVIGRKAESAFVFAVLDHLRRDGVETVEAEFLPTAKNQLVQNFYTDHGFAEAGPQKFSLALGAALAQQLADIPIKVTLTDRG